MFQLRSRDHESKFFLGEETVDVVFVDDPNNAYWFPSFVELEQAQR